MRASPLLIDEKQFMALEKVRLIRNDLLLILAVWSLLITTLLVLQMLGFDFGFNVWPTGEFRSWIQYLQEGDGVNATKLFWAMDNRNALSPWWYIFARPLINATPAAPLILHLLVGLFVGIAAYLLLAELTRSRPFALSVGSLSALFIPNAYLSDVIWHLVGALGCTLMSIWLFALFCKDRLKSGYLAASYLAWFVAISTYTIQIGAMGAVFFVSLRERLSMVPWPRAVVGAVADALPYALLLILYVMLWITTSWAGVPGALHFQFSFDALAKSIAFAFWNGNYQTFWIWLIDAGPRLMALAFVLLTVAMLALLRAMGVGNYARPTMQSLAFVFLISACVVGPTVVLEAISDVWIPGTRWPMVMQFWSPLVVCVLVFTAMSAVPDRFWWPLWKGVTACATAFIILLVLGFNHTQVVHVRKERTFFNELQSAVTQDGISGLTFPRRYVIQYAETAPLIPVGHLADVYAHTILGRHVTFEFVTVLPEPSANNTFLIWKDQQLSRPFAAVSDETSASPVRP
jgi:hypothetical protein